MTRQLILVNFCPFGGKYGIVVVLFKNPYLLEIVKYLWMK